MVDQDERDDMNKQNLVVISGERFWYNLQKKVQSVDWFVANGILLADWNDLEKVGINWIETDPLDCGVDMKEEPLLVDYVLKRFDMEGRPYHA